ncbi:HNH endonuclease [Devosia sp. Root436]|uniref:HNH endonuclease n=1 Tax=Devosia sp. Root436 TaxID=1736537 RepID=UPI000A91BD5F|nr:HNH endonuclease [Devosia sp. Root436]
MVKTLGNRIGTAKPRLSTPRQVRDTRYSPDATVRGWYKSARWQALRQEVLARDLYTCQHTGVLLTGKAPAPDSPVVHHKVPHKGDERLFWDMSNLEAVSKEWHDSEAQREERKPS